MELFYGNKSATILGQNWEQDDPTEEAYLVYKIRVDGRILWVSGREIKDSTGRNLIELEQAERDWVLDNYNREQAQKRKDAELRQVIPRYAIDDFDAPF